MTSVDLSTVGKQGAAAGMTQVYDYGDVDGSNFTITQYVERYTGSNPRTPFQNGATGGYTQYSAGPRDDTSETLGYYRVRLVSTLPLESIVWAARGISGNTGEDISFVSNSGTTSGLSNTETGTVTWTNLPDNTFEVYFLVVSSSDGNNSGFGRPDSGSAVIATGGGDGDGETYIRAGTVTAEGTATTPGVWDVFVPITDANGSVGTVPLRIIVEPGDPPVLTSPNNQFDDIGDTVSLALSSTNPQSHTLVYSADNLPPPLVIDSGTGVISGVPTTAGSYQVELVVKDEWGQCSTVVIDWEVDGENQNNLDDVTGPVVIGRLSGTGERLPLDPQTARATIDTYSKTQIDSKDTTTLATVRGGINDDWNTLEKLRVYLESLLELIDGGGGNVDLSPIYTILGLSENATEFPAIGALAAGSAYSLFEDLEARIPDDTAALPDMPGETMLVRALTSTGPPSNKTYAEVRSILSLYTQAEIGALLAAKFDDSKGDDLVTLTGMSVNSEDLGSFSGSTIPNDRKIKEALQDLETKVEAVENGQGSGISIAANSIAANFESTSGEVSGKTASQIRAFLDVLTSTQIQTDLNTLGAQLEGYTDGEINALSASVSALLGFKASQDQVDRLTQLSGASANSLHYSSFPGNTLSDFINTYQALVALEAAHEDLQDEVNDLETRYLGDAVWSDKNLSSVHTGRGWVEALSIKVRLSASKDEVHIIGAVVRLSGSSTFLHGSSILSAALPSNLRPPQDTTFAIRGSGSDGVRRRAGEVTVKSGNGQLLLSGDDGDSGDTTRYWSLDGRWSVGN